MITQFSISFVFEIDDQNVVFRADEIFGKRQILIHISCIDRGRS